MIPLSITLTDYSRISTCYNLIVQYLYILILSCFHPQCTLVFIRSWWWKHRFRKPQSLINFHTYILQSDTYVLRIRKEIFCVLSKLVKWWLNLGKGLSTLKMTTVQLKTFKLWIVESISRPIFVVGRGEGNLIVDPMHTYIGGTQNSYMTIV